MIGSDADRFFLRPNFALTPT
jgi:hypothetical protein